MSIVDMFRIALHNVGKSDVRYITGGVLQRRKSRNPVLEVPKVTSYNISIFCLPLYYLHILGYATQSLRIATRTNQHEGNIQCGRSILKIGTVT